ncbi:MAG TPA: hypothetical protein VKZ63_04820, partial [Kofleriaceae bacterium]|nr:hypothetical protein [Kofleriaceae bacterium]
GASSTSAGGYGAASAGARPAGSTLGHGAGAAPAGAAHGAARAGGTAAPVPLFGGPPAMPKGEVGGELTPPPPRSAGPSVGDEDSIVVDMAEGDPARLRKELDESLAAQEKLQAAYDREVADGKRLRAEIVTHKDRIEELRRALAERDDVVEAHSRVADELREEIRQAKDALASARAEAAEMGDLVAARERQLARTHEDIGQLKREMEDKERQLLELSRTKDEGWRKLNEQLTEIEHLREVINQQERMLEERRVGLISQDEIIKELRAEKEQQLRDVAHLKAERDELRSDLGRLRAQVTAIDEENRRLTALLAELRAKRSQGEEDHEAAAHTQAVSAELKTLRIALKTVESDRDHLRNLAEQAEAEVERLREKVASLEVELRDAHDERERAAAGKSVSDDAMARAELARHKAAEEAVAATRAREEALRTADELRRELDKARRRLTELEEGTGTGPSPAELDLAEKNRKLERKLAEAGEQLSALEAELRTARAEREAARRASRTMQAVQPPPEEGDDATAVVTAGANPGAIKDRAIDVHDSINDVLSELRNNAMILHEEFIRDPSERSPESSRIMGEAIEAVLGHAEEAKGVLRRLRELVEFGEP